MNIRTFSVIITAVLLLLSFTAAPAFAQNPPPPSEPDQSWNPPEEGGESLMQSGVESKSSSTYYPPSAPGIAPRIQGAYFIDEVGLSRTEFTDEAFYLVVQTNSAGLIHVAEYYPPDSGRSPVWLVYRHYLEHAGAWTLGPFYAEPNEPVGRHTWRLWLFSSGTWAQASTGFGYLSRYRPIANPPAPDAGGWGSWQVLVIAVLMCALGITIGMLVANRHRYSS